MYKYELVKLLKMFDDYDEIVTKGRVEDEYIEVEIIYKNEDGQIVVE